MNRDRSADRQAIIASMKKAGAYAFILKISDTTIDYNEWLIKREYGKRNKILRRRCPDHPHYGFFAACYLNRYDICHAYSNGIFYFRIHNDDLLIIRCKK